MASGKNAGDTVMTSALLTLAILSSPAQTTNERKPHPLAPSLTLLTKEQYAEFERIIDRFVLYDTGKLTGEEGKKALKDFNALGRQAFFQLVEGLNKAANMEDSCPAVIIGKKLRSIIYTSDDLELLMFARETIGLDVKAKRHTATIKDLQTAAQLRSAQVKRAQATTKRPPVKTPPAAKSTLESMSVADLARAAAQERGPALKGILTEIEKRDDRKVLDTLGIAAASYEKDIRTLGQSLLAKHLSRQKLDALKAQFKHDRPEVRIASAQVVGTKKLRWGDELIALLEDSEDSVRQAARSALVRLTGGAD